MTEENKDTEKEESSDSEIKPPMPDVPVEAAPSSFPASKPKPEPSPASPSAQMKMAGEIESGGTPYNYSDYGGAREEDPASGKKPARRFSMTNVLALTAVGALIMVSVVGWRIMETVSVKIDGVNSTVERLTDRLLLESRFAKQTGRAVIRAELKKSLKSLEHLIATGDPLVRTEAIKLKNEIREVMVLLAAGQVEKEIDTRNQVEAEPEPEPADEVEAPLGGEEEPDTLENMEQERVDEAQDESAPPL